MQGAQRVLSSHSLSCTLMCQELLSLLMAAPSLVWFGATVYPAHLAPWSEFWIPSLSSQVYFIPWLMHSGSGLVLPYLLCSIICPCMPCKIFSVIFLCFAYVYICMCLQQANVWAGMYVCIWLHLEAKGQVWLSPLSHYQFVFLQFPIALVLCWLASESRGSTSPIKVSFEMAL